MDTTPNHPFIVEYPAETVRIHPAHKDRKQFIFRFANGYGASVISEYEFRDNDYSVLLPIEGLYEIAQLIFNSADPLDYNLKYTNDDFNDVVRRLTTKEVPKYLEMIRGKENA